MLVVHFFRSVAYYIWMRCRYDIVYLHLCARGMILHYLSARKSTCSIIETTARRGNLNSKFMHREIYIYYIYNPRTSLSGWPHTPRGYVQSLEEIPSDRAQRFSPRRIHHYRRLKLLISAAAGTSGTYLVRKLFLLLL